MGNATANCLNNKGLHENWLLSSKSQEAKISYLMVEQVKPPDYLWEKISNRLNKQMPMAQPLILPSRYTEKNIGLLIAVATFSIAAILYFLI